MAADLLKDDELKRLIIQAQLHDANAKAILVEKNERLVWSIVNRYKHRGYESEDLFQMGSIGLIKAIDKFDLSYDVKFSTYAVPMIIGEIQRFLRDDGVIKVSRTLKEIAVKVHHQRERIMKSTGKVPSIHELAVQLDLTTEQIIEAEEAVRRPQSIYESIYESDGQAILCLDQLASDAPDVVERLLVTDSLNRLARREKIIMYLRYFKDCTQMEVAERLGISQVQVSRLEKKSLQLLKNYLSQEV